MLVNVWNANGAGGQQAPVFLMQFKQAQAMMQGSGSAGFAALSVIAEEAGTKTKT
ncbi:hypothetical protein C0995_012868 [Termitomyces sp. Mi166|nr:hypothetical protein C0995_012868 [Termitomyces sp. Mi166\